MKKGPLAVIFVIIFIDLMGFGIVIPLLPLYAEQYKPGPLSFGLLMAAYSAMQFFFTPILGRLSDRWGRKPVLVVSLAGSIVGYLLFGFARSLVMLFASRIVDGISGGNIATAQAYVADITVPEERTRGMGVVGAAIGLGFVFGPAIGGVTSHWGEAGPGIAAAALALAAAVGTIVFLPEPPRQHKRGASDVARTLSGRGLSEVFRRPAVAVVFGIAFLVTFAFSNFEATLAQDLHDRFSISLAHVAYVFVYIGLLVAVVQGGLIRPLSRKFTEHRLIREGVFLFAAGLFLLPLAATAGWALLFLAPLAAGIGTALPSLSSLVSRLAGESDRGAVLGVYQSLRSLGRILGPLWGEMAYFRFGPSAPQWTGAIVAALAGCVALFLLRSKVAQER